MSASYSVSKRQPLQTSGRALPRIRSQQFRSAGIRQGLSPRNATTRNVATRSIGTKKLLSSQGDSRSGVGTKAVVIGSGIAGLATAFSLSSKFDEIVLLERDTLSPASSATPEGALDNELLASRKGVSQYAHVHGLLVRGEQILCEMFPNIANDLSSRGARPMQVGTDFKYVLGSQVQCKNPVTQTFNCSRPMIETYMRERVLNTANIHMMTSAVVTSIVTDPASNAVTAVRIADGTEVKADIFVAAAGRNSKLHAWLQNAGYVVPDAEVVDPKLAYGGVTVRVPEKFRGVGTVVEQPMPGLRGGVFVPYEKDLGMVNLFSYGGLEPPADMDGFIAFAESLPNPLIAEVLKESEWVSDVRYYRGVRNAWRPYHQVTVPDNLCILGDAVCGFNPVYAQGMTVALREVKLLNEVLAARMHGSGVNMTGLSCEFHKAMVPIVQEAWMAAVSRDRVRAGIPDDENAPAIAKFMNAYMAACLECSWQDAEVGNAFLRMANMLEPGTYMLKQAHRVLPFMLKQKLRGMFQPTTPAVVVPSSP